MDSKIKSLFETSIEQHMQVASTLKMLEKDFYDLVSLCVEVLSSGHKILICGNGGSASQADHISGELVGKFMFKRDALPAISLSSNNTVITATGNDYSFDDVFARQVEAYGQPGDLLIALSTSGTSKNIIKALIAAKNNKMHTVAFVGANTSEVAPYSDVIISVKSTNTPRIQEMHIFIAHMMCEAVENIMFT